MANNEKILVVEDELTNSILIKRLLSKQGFQVVMANNGLDALKIIEKENFDAVLTDWMMPQMDGIELIRRIRDTIKPTPYMIMITALVSEGAKQYALDSGADDFVAKPIDVNELTNRVIDGIAKHNQVNLKTPTTVNKLDPNVKPPFVGVAIATSTGGPPALVEVFKSLVASDNAAYFIVQHGPPWMLETFAQRLQKETVMPVHLASNGANIEVGHIYIAAGDLHMTVVPKTYKLVLDDSPKENFVRPAADPLFRSVAEAFGKYSIGVVMTGLGKDGTAGAELMVSNGSKLLVQDPSTAIATSMPNSVINQNLECKVVPLTSLGNQIHETILSIAKTL